MVTFDAAALPAVKIEHDVSKPTPLKEMIEIGIFKEVISQVRCMADRVEKGGKVGLGSEREKERGNVSVGKIKILILEESVPQVRSILRACGQALVLDMCSQHSAFLLYAYKHWTSIESGPFRPFLVAKNQSPAWLFVGTSGTSSLFGTWITTTLAVIQCVVLAL